MLGALMARFDLFSKRQNDAAKAGQSDVYRYDFVPSAFRVQLLNLAQKAFGEDRHYRKGVGHYSNAKWIWIDETYCHEKGINPLGGSEHLPSKIRDAFKTMDHEDALDMVEVITFRIMEVDIEVANIYQSRVQTQSAS